MDQKLSSDAIGFGWQRAGRDVAPWLTVLAIAGSTWVTVAGIVSAQVTIAFAVVSVAGVFLSYWALSRPVILRVRPEQWKPGDPTNPDQAPRYVEVKNSAHGFDSPRFTIGVSVDGRLMMEGTDAMTGPFLDGVRVFTMSGENPDADYYILEIRP